MTLSLRRIRKYVPLFVRPCELSEANIFIGQGSTRRHRHHDRVQGHRWSLKVVDSRGTCRGDATAGRPVGRMAGRPTEVLEVTRLCTDGTPNACSMLYAACARAAQAMGFYKIQTYILDTEPGTSLKAAGWEDEGPTGGGFWTYSVPKKKRKHGGFFPEVSKVDRKNSHPLGIKRKYSRRLNPKIVVCKVVG